MRTEGHVHRVPGHMVWSDAVRDADLRPEGFRPAPERRPPHVRGRSSTCAGWGILIEAGLAEF